MESHDHYRPEMTWHIKWKKKIRFPRRITNQIESTKSPLLRGSNRKFCVCVQGINLSITHNFANRNICKHTRLKQLVKKARYHGQVNENIWKWRSCKYIPAVVLWYTCTGIKPRTEQIWDVFIPLLTQNLNSACNSNFAEENRWTTHVRVSNFILCSFQFHRFFGL